ncbi:Hsp70 family protein [Glycomyces artemisiae]|uniref:Hsp70 protein n=1 Tax=Glycomyces artemisiae TaxID=1076443 RepID=A0A2T0US55_9ACTN|nr:Hsp70 family protein [Glycomyces artemisiae]PRY60734.1 Hsp70 protein [Glycomyces artemisiae]
MSPGPQGTSLGVDFGTSHTIAVVRRADGSVRPLLFDGAPLMPSAVCADGDGGLLVGKDAVHAGRRHPERFEPNPKRLIDLPSTLLGEREFAVADLIAAVLDAVADECRRVVGRPAQTTLTFPAEWGPARRRVLEDAAARSGLGAVRMVPEPVAAATYYAETLKHRAAVGSSIVVYDLGAGTFDASVVRRTETGFETVALDGRGDLGGLDIDAALIEHLGSVYGDRDGWKRLVNPTTIEERRSFREFQEEVRGAKERLSRHQQSDIAIPLLDVEAHLTRTELEQLARPHLEQTIRVTQAVIRAADLNLADSAGVFLVGGASRMPLVATLLHRELGVAPTVLDQPEVVVAEGSVLWSGPDTSTLSLQRPYTPPAQPAPSPLTPQTAVSLAPHTPHAPRTSYRQDSPPRTAPLPQSPPAPSAQALPPRTAQPVTPPMSVSGSDPEPPETDADRLRRKKVGRRLLAGFIAVDLLIIAGLAWYFNRDEGEDVDPFDSGVIATAFEPNWTTAEAGTLLSEITGAHTDRVQSLAAAENEGGTTLFSAGDDGVIRQWDMASGEMVDQFDIGTGVQALWPVPASNGDELVVALGTGTVPYVWSPETGDFTETLLPEMVAEGADNLYNRVGTVEFYATLGMLNDDEYELFDLQNQITRSRFDLPDGYGYPRFYSTIDGASMNIVAVTGDQTVDVIDGRTGEPMGLNMSDDQMDGVVTEAFGVVYDFHTPYAMLYGDDGLLHFWDLEGQTPALSPLAYESLDDEFHYEMVDMSLDGDVEQSLLYINEHDEARAVAIGTGETVDFASDGGGSPLKLVDVTVDGVQYAVTGDDQGNIRFWSLGQ